MALTIWRVIGLLGIVSLSMSCQSISNRANADSTRMEQTQTVNAEDKPTVADPLELPVIAKLDGNYMKAFLVAYASFKDDSLVPEAKREIRNYEIEFRQHGNNYYVLFLAKRKPTERELLGGESELGKDVMYTIDKENFHIVDRKFYK